MPRAALANVYVVDAISRLLIVIGLFAEYRLFYRALLQKRPITLRSLLMVATPYVHVYVYMYTYAHIHLDTHM